MSAHNAVAHAWANQTGKNRKGFNMYYEGDTIYSYGRHFPIAKMVRDKDGRRVVLFTTEGYSVSTAKHKTITWRACHHMPIFNVPYVDASGHAPDNAKSYMARITDLIGKAKRARVYKDMHLRHAGELMEEMQRFVVAFDVPGYEGFVWSLDSIETGMAELAKREAERQAAMIAERAVEYAKREAEAKRNYRENTWPRIKAWLRGSELPYHIGHTPRPLPRIEGDKVVTTWGATVPLNVAIMLYRKAVQCRRTHEEFTPGSRDLRVGDFHLSRIKTNGDLVVGCHDINFWFMRYAACKAGITATA